jgi:hypothetical protein
MFGRLRRGWWCCKRLAEVWSIAVGNSCKQGRQWRQQQACTVMHLWHVQGAWRCIFICCGKGLCSGQLAVADQAAAAVAAQIGRVGPVWHWQQAVDNGVVQVQQRSACGAWLSFYALSCTVSRQCNSADVVEGCWRVLVGKLRCNGG